MGVGMEFLLGVFVGVFGCVWLYFFIDNIHRERKFYYDFQKEYDFYKEKE